MHQNLRNLIGDVRRAGRARAWHAAVALTLTFPDICAAAEGQPQCRDRYVDWCENYLTPRFSLPKVDGGDQTITGFDVYALRCAFLHSGMDDVATHSKATLDKIVLTESGDVSSVGIRKFQIPYDGQQGKIALPVGDFCGQMIAAVEDWVNTITEPDIIARLASL